MAEGHTHRVEQRRGDRVTEIWAWVAIDPQDDCEAVVSHPAAPGGLLFGADEQRVRCLEPLAADASAALGLEVKLVRFGGRQEIRTLGTGRGHG